MKGFRRHIAASIAITSVFLVCAIAIGMGAAPARAPEQVAEQPEVLESSVAAAPVQSAAADAIEVPAQTVTDAISATSDPSPVQPAVSQPAAAPQAPAEPEAEPDAPAPPEVIPAAAPNPPRNLVGTFSGTGTIYVRLTWSAPSGGSRVRTYRIYREEVGGLVPMASTPLAETRNRNYNDYAIQPDVLYHYWVTGVNRQGEEGSPSNIVEVQTYSNLPPAPPQGESAYAIDPGVSLDWLPNTDKNLAGYNVYEWSHNRWRKRNGSLLTDNHFYYSSGAAGSTYAVSAVNFAGIESAYTSVVPVQTTPVIYEESDPSITVSGLWAIEHYTGPSNGTIRVAGDAGAMLSFKFTGSQVKLAVARYWTCGSANIYLDGSLYSTVNLYNRTTSYNYIPVNIPGIKHGSHTLTVEVVGSGNPGGTYNFVNVDYFEVRDSAAVPK